jgi:hypothetical protein
LRGSGKGWSLGSGRVSAEVIVPPIVVAEGLDLSFHRTPEDVVRQYEPWFPGDADYRAYDAEGRRLELVADPPVKSKRLIGPIRTDNAHESSLTVRATEAEPSGADEFAELLHRWLIELGERLEDPQRLTLRELLDRALAHAGFK